MPNLTTLTAASVRGESKTAIVRKIFQEAGVDADVPKVAIELKRLHGEEITVQAVYSIRKEIRDANLTETAAKVPPVPLSEVETFFKVRAFVKEIGGVAKLRAYLALVEKDELEKGHS